MIEKWQQQQWQHQNRIGKSSFLRFMYANRMYVTPPICTTRPLLIRHTLGEICDAGGDWRFILLPKCKNSWQPQLNFMSEMSKISLNFMLRRLSIMFYGENMDFQANFGKYLTEIGDFCWILGRNVYKSLIFCKSPWIF